MVVAVVAMVVTVMRLPSLRRPRRDTFLFLLLVIGVFIRIFGRFFLLRLLSPASSSGSSLFPFFLSFPLSVLFRRFFPFPFLASLFVGRIRLRTPVKSSGGYLYAIMHVCVPDCSGFETNFKSFLKNLSNRDLPSGP